MSAFLGMFMLVKRNPKICLDVLSITNSKSDEVKSPAVPIGFSSASSVDVLTRVLKTV